MKPAKPYPGLGPFVVLCAPGDPYRGANSYAQARIYLAQIRHYPGRRIVSNLPGEAPNTPAPPPEPRTFCTAGCAAPCPAAQRGGDC